MKIRHKHANASSGDDRSRHCLPDCGINQVTMSLGVNPGIVLDRENSPASIDGAKPAGAEDDLFPLESSS